jgi:hypothetical protein
VDASFSGKEMLRKKQGHSIGIDTCIESFESIIFGFRYASFVTLYTVFVVCDHRASIIIVSKASCPSTFCQLAYIIFEISTLFAG